ncbi:MAG TPA: TetR/AcrR family transcriptional regulator [Nonomuraea sp.]|uniref:TetR/AcrR family transcriptional regulator n=1 Tax=Nonomuraea sp. NPDC049649 TaxID=3155776 RepID=UPI002C20636D|nr:TetR/AcrR family transcriptional regulator [Nonomuraea sp.]
MDAERDRLIGVATRLFAELGYDWTSMRMIADAAGVDPEQVTQAVGDKPELYQEVMARALRAEQEVVRSALRSATPGVQAALDLVDAYLDFNLAHPEYLSLWLHRWTGDAADTPDLEGLYSRPLAFEVAEAMQGLTPDGVSVDHLLWTVVWCVYGFLSGGVRYVSRQRGDEADPEAVEEFRAYLHTLVRRMTAPVG